ncbi:IclR family transcriptional regulator [Amycolatopsis rubida]|uniref:IclR family transcriptional regulator n=2 Tax=Pseudonocardiaceae TaxID=2070 RepID=A0ABX0BZ22_9PSEU|nr:helix-turn-helix domain-containing protein [Amycolatopsis rubida]NEC60173.1 IclR family transcriptional regulator [Amycolatopsis rubida]OAP28419.1 Acetate operon repressor [Amycolatopsis sp. M39]
MRHMHDEEADKPASGVRTMNSVLSTLRVFEEVAQRQPIGVSELARCTEIPKSTVQRGLMTLQQAGWLKVVDAERARWGVAPRVLALGLRDCGKPDLKEVAGPVIKRLAAETDETVMLAERDGDNLVIVATQHTDQIVRVVLDVGTRIPLLATSGGTAIMARLDESEVEELFTHELPEFAQNPGPDFVALRRDIALTAKRGYALNGSSSWYRPQVSSIGAAITDPAGRPVATITLAIPDMRYTRAQEKTFAPLVVAAAAEVSRLLAEN